MKTVALVLCSLVVSLAVGEGIVRIAGLGRTTLSRGSLHEYDPDVGWKCKSSLDANYTLPGSFDARIRCNAESLRGGALPREKAAGITRIAILGDSTMWGFGVEDEEVFAHVLSNHIPGSETINLAANGYSTVQELIRLEQQGLAYDPDWTVVAFSSNDLEDNFDDKHGGRPIAEIVEGNEIRIANHPVRRPWKSPSEQWFRHHSRLWSFFEYSFKLIGETWIRKFRRVVDDPMAFAGSAPGSEKMEFMERDLYAPTIPPLERAWETLRILLGRIDALQRARGGRTLVVFTTSKYSMTPDQFVDLFGDEPDLDWSRPARRLEQIARSLDIEFVDLNPAFRSAPDPMALYLVNNGHWNAAGHALAARVTAEHLAAVMNPSKGPAVGTGPAAR